MKSPKFPLVSKGLMFPDDEHLNIIEASSDMLVLDVHQNDAGYKVGDLITFKLKYMGVLGIMNSNYVDKLLVDA